jgi:hypothetical protein
MATLDIKTENNETFHWEHISATAALVMISKYTNISEWHFKSTETELFGRNI